MRSSGEKTYLALWTVYSTPPHLCYLRVAQESRCFSSSAFVISGSSQPPSRRQPEGRSSRDRLHPSAQHLGDAPGLGDAAARRERRLGVEDLADRADARLARGACAKPSRNCRAPARSSGWTLQPGVDERADQPGPDRPLVVGGVARAQVAVSSAACSRAARARASAGRPASAAARAPRPSTGSQRVAVEHRMVAARWRRPGSAGRRVVALSRRRPRRTDSRPRRTRSAR